MTTNKVALCGCLLAINLFSPLGIYVFSYQLAITHASNEHGDIADVNQRIAAMHGVVAREMAKMRPLYIPVIIMAVVNSLFLGWLVASHFRRKE
jgi:hypothetical protein